MTSKIIYVMSIVIFSLQVYAQTPLLKPQPSNPEQDSLINKGTILHDQGKYDEAISAYRAVLKKNPSNVIALYELSYSLFANKDYDGALQSSMEGIKYQSKHHALFYLNIASALDNLGKTDEAIKTYHTGIQIDPMDHLFPYNLGLTYYRNKQPDSARFYFQKAMELNPFHPTSNLGLSFVYRDMGKKIPRLFALSRFLILEPSSQRSKDALSQILGIFDTYTSIDVADSQKINVTVTPDSDDVDGDMSVLDLSLAVTQATRSTDAGKGKTDVQWRVHAFQSFFQIMLELCEKQSFHGFCWNYYAPFFIEMQHHGLTETFVYFISKCSESDEVDEWMKSHNEKVKEFIAWNKKYRW